MDDHTSIANILHDLIRECQEFINSFKIDNKDSQVMYAIALYGRMLELMLDIIILITNNTFTSIPIIIRSIYEAYNDMLLLIEDRKHLESMYVAHLVSRKLMFDYAKSNPESPFHVSLANASKFETVVIETKIELEDLENVKNAKRLKPHQKFKKLKKEHEFHSIYSMLSQDCHNDLRILENRHFFEDQKGIHLQIGRDHNLQDIFPEISLLIDILSYSPRKISELSGLQIPERSLVQIEKMCAKSYDSIHNLNLPFIIPVTPTPLVND